MATVKNMTLLKTLAAIAWADGEMSESEKNILKRFYRKFHLTQKEMDSLKPYLLAPVTREEQDRLLQKLSHEFGSKKERDRVVQVMEEMAAADKSLKDEERELLETFAKHLKKSSITRRTVGKIRNFFESTIFQPAYEKNPQLHQYFRNQILKSIELKSNGSVKKGRISEEDLYFICLFGTLLASVAHVDEEFHEEEKKALKSELKKRFEFTPKELDLLLEVVSEQAQRGYDFDEVTREFNKLYSYNDRMATVDCFFAVAAADGNISHEESEEIRRITKALRIPHSAFKASKVRALNKLRGR
ncbi:tellurite resistance TerB family protein [Nitrospina gracilis]|uniref:tellurite resistance TerB family protein n=1 Tax=Nitrospina gracilis TaxID=35801 RepID=UPI001F31F4BD|nr:TerB family tellurite resistance protein [Nitrospina gracilis]MCF8720127.1 putative tellurite resistance protein B-like protein [Nitrospina gracilis Nb-211]